MRGCGKVVYKMAFLYSVGVLIIIISTRSLLDQLFYLLPCAKIKSTYSRSCLEPHWNASSSSSAMVCIFCCKILANFQSLPKTSSKLKVIPYITKAQIP